MLTLGWNMNVGKGKRKTHRKKNVEIHIKNPKLRDWIASKNVKKKRKGKWHNSSSSAVAMYVNLMRSTWMRTNKAMLDEKKK